jgi:hypothetical protein
MVTATDNLNCIKNLIQLMCCDGTLRTAEKSFWFSSNKVG